MAPELVCVFVSTEIFSASQPQLFFSFSDRSLLAFYFLQFLIQNVGNCFKERKFTNLTKVHNIHPGATNPYYQQTTRCFQCRRL